MRLTTRHTARHTHPHNLRNAGTPWTETDLDRLRTLARQRTPTRTIAVELGRSPSSVQQKASELGVSLKRERRSPYADAA
jgi:hypothetical protein